MKVAVKLFGILCTSSLMLSTFSSAASAKPKAKVVVADPIPVVVQQKVANLVLKTHFVYVEDKLIGTPYARFTIHNVSPFTVGKSELLLTLKDAQGGQLDQKVITVANLGPKAKLTQNIYFPGLFVDGLSQQSLTMTSLTLVGPSGEVYPSQERTFAVSTDSKIVSR